MIALLAIAGLPRLDPEAARWKPAFDKLCTRPGEYRRLLADKGPTQRKVKKWLAAAGVLANWEGKHKRPGLAVLEDGFVPVRRERGALVILLMWEHKEGDFCEDACLALFETKGNHITASLLDREYPKTEPILPAYAARVSDTVVVSGMDDWYGTGATAVAQSFRPKYDGWARVGCASTEFQCDTPFPLKLSPDGKRLLPIPVKGRTYPETMTPCHAGAQYGMETTWTFPNGIATSGREVVRDTPYNTLDHLCGYLASEQKAKVRSLCSTEATFKKVWALRERHGGLNVLCGDTEERSILIEDLATFHFVRHSGKWVVARVTPVEKADHE